MGSLPCSGNTGSVQVLDGEAIMDQQSESRGRPNFLCLGLIVIKVVVCVIYAIIRFYFIVEIFLYCMKSTKIPYCDILLWKKLDEYLTMHISITLANE